MDQDNENGQETHSDTRETDPEGQPSSTQELSNVKDINNSETAVKEAPVDLPKETEDETKLSSDCNVRPVNSSTEDKDNNESDPSPAPTDDVRTGSKEGEETTKADASPLSSSSEREIALDGNEAVELSDKKDDSAFANENCDSNLSTEVSKEENDPETNIDGDKLQQPVDASIPPSTEETKDADSTVLGVDGNEDREKESPAGSEEKVLSADTVIQEKIEEDDSNLAAVTTDKVECDVTNVNEDAGEESKMEEANLSCDAGEESKMEETNVSCDAGEESKMEETNVSCDAGEESKMEETNLSCDADEMKENEDKDEDDGKVSFVNSAIDTSIFPKPPRESESNVVVANCFQLDVMSQSVSDSDFVSSDNLQTSCEIRDTIDSTAECKSALSGPSDDREDISDEELDLECASNVQQGGESNPIPSSASDHPGDSLNSESFVHKSDNLSLNSSDVGDIIDLKLEDAALKSIGSSCDKVSNEDLEAVSDDELPNVPHVSDLVINPSNPSLLDDREEVSSSEDEELDKPQNLDATPISSEDEFPSQIEEASAISSEKDFSDPAHQPPDSHAVGESLEAEPISDEEDTNIVSDEPAKNENSFDEGEAGEIKSPALGSPISEQGDLMLGEVEPVSADESQDTDGELPSGDENEKGADKDKKFESIDSDEDIPGESSQRPMHSVEGGKSEYLASSEGVNKSGGDKDAYMETISDEENLDGEDSGKKCEGPVSQGAVNRSEESQNAMEKGCIPTGFNEHQVELDYEEGYGEEGGGDSKLDSKEDESKAEPKPTECEEGEHSDQDQGLVSDKDEGELSDDDCEEGEIKEPGQRKMFVKPICRFFQRGHCTWGISCRFLHPGVNDKGNYQMIEVPGFKPVGIHARLGVPGQYPDQQPPAQEEAELPPPPMPDVPHVETAWERGLRIAKEQRKKASERKEQEPDFEEKRLNLSVEEDRELNKENERTPRIAPKDTYYDQQAYEVDEYYKIPRDPWHTGHYENFEVRYHQQENAAYSPPYREKPPPIIPPPMRYDTRPLSPPIDKFGRHREDRPAPPPPERHHEPIRVSDYPPPVNKHPDEWIDPWRRSKSPKQRKPRSRSRGRKNRRSLSDSSDSSRSSRSSSGSSRSSRSGSSSSSSRSRSPEPAPPGVDRHDRYGNDQPRSMVSVRGPEGRGGTGGGGGGGGGGYNNRYNDNNNNFRYGRGIQGYSSNNNNNNRGGGGFRNSHNPRQDMYQGGRGGGGPGGYNNNYRGYGGRGGGGGYHNNNRDPRGRYGGGRNMSPSRGGRGPTPDRPLPYTRPRPKSRSSSRSSSSRSRSRSRSKSSDSSRSRSSSNSSRSSSSSSSSGGSADSDHLYRDLGSPSKTGRHPASQKKRPGLDNRKDNRNAKSNHHTSSTSQSASRHPPPPSGIDGSRAAHPRSPPHTRSSGGGDPKYSQIPLPPPSSSSSSARGDTKYASRNAPQPPVKAKDPLKVVGQKNIKLTLLPKQQQQSNLGDRPNPLASPPHKRRMSDRDLSPPTPPLNKRPNLSMQASSLRMAADKAAKLQIRSDKAKSPPPGSLPPPQSLTSSSSSSATQRSKNSLPPTTSPQKQSTGKSRPAGEPVSAKPTSKAPSGGSAPSSSSNPSGAKAKKSMSSRREELLKQLKAVEDAIARKKFKMS